MWACNHLKTSNFSADNGPRWVYSWARDTVRWYWSVDTLFWQLPIDHNIDVQSASSWASKVACVASVSSRGSSRKLGQEQKKINDGGGEGEPWNIKGRSPESWGLGASVSSSPLPLPLQPFFCFLSNFRAITRLETLATQANLVPRASHHFLGKSPGDKVQWMHGHSLLCMVYVLYIIDRARQLKLFHFVAPAFAHAFTFQTCEPRQRKRQCKRKD